MLHRITLNIFRERSTRITCSINAIKTVITSVYNSGKRRKRTAFKLFLLIV